jgi:hypothetical protein
MVSLEDPKTKDELSEEDQRTLPHWFRVERTCSVVKMGYLESQL